MGKSNITCAGIDTGKDKLDVAVQGTGEIVQMANDATGQAALVAWLRQRGVARVGIEASGGYEREVVARLRAAGFAVVVFQPRQVRAYAVYRLRRAKNDTIDAALIAACTAEADEIRSAPDARLSALADHLTFVEQIEEDMRRLKNRIETQPIPRLRDALNAQLAALRKLRQQEIAYLAAALRAAPDLAERLALVLSVPGIGLRTALALLVRMPELGTLEREAAAALAGLAPFDNDSGRMRKARHIAGGRGRLRTALFAAALPASFRWNPALVALYKRLTANGKPHRVAMVACARKLLIYANTVVARGTPWQLACPAS